VKLPDPPLLVISDRGRARRPLEEVAAASFAAGCRWFSLREKDLAPAERRLLLRRLVVLGAAYGAAVMVHADVAAAATCGAAGVHLPGGVAPTRQRNRLPAGALIGCSAHDAAELAAAAAGGADYATLSPIFASASKPGYGPALGLARLGAAVAASPLPVIALGGIDETSAPACLYAGAAGIAVMGGIMAAADPGMAVMNLLAAMAPALVARRDGRHSAPG
jgi:thiamine-phosphate pyrophosphorylase